MGDFEFLYGEAYELFGIISKDYLAPPNPDERNRCEDKESIENFGIQEIVGKTSPCKSFSRSN